MDKCCETLSVSVVYLCELFELVKIMNDFNYLHGVMKSRHLHDIFSRRIGALPSDLPAP
jgi:hypothetical protein